MLSLFSLKSVGRKGTRHAISKAQKAQNIFLEKKLFSFGKCRTVPKNVKGGTLFDL